jgi:hypothetical protein
MVPSVVVALEAFPMLPGGKVDVKSLPEPDWTLSEDEYVAPGNPLEEALQVIWMNVLGIKNPISVLADFFAIGGTSLHIGMVNAAIRRELDLEELAGV